MSNIAHIDARQVFDSRGNPTVEADVILEDGSKGSAIVPSGASTGSREAHELRDTSSKAYGGKGVEQAVINIQTTIKEHIVGRDAGKQNKIDAAMIALDGTKDKRRLGANAILAVSLAIAKAHAQSSGMPLYEYVATLSRIRRAPLLPIPMCNVINGGRHAKGSTDIQEFMILPVGAERFTDAMQMVTEIFHTLGEILETKGYATTVGDEGGYAPSVREGNREALALLVEAIETAGYESGTDVTLAIDVAATELFDNGAYSLKSEGKRFTAHEMFEYYDMLIDSFPLVSIEDGIQENDWEGWQQMTERMGAELQLVGDDLLVTNPMYLQKAITSKSANTILIKPNQIGTLTETIEAVDMAHSAGWNAIMSHRSGETEDVTIAHLAVGLATGEIKTGSPCRGERTAKYNELLRIEGELGDKARYGFLT